MTVEKRPDRSWFPEDLEGSARYNYWKRVIGSVALYTAVIVVVFIMVVPIIWLFLTSIRPMIEITTVRLNLIPENPTFRNYVTVFDTYNLGAYLRTTAIVSVVVVIANLVLGAPAAYSLARYKFFGDTAMYGSIVFFRMIPPVAAIVPLFILAEQFRLLGTLSGLIIAHTAFKLPVTIWLLRNFFMDVPKDLDDAARVDGCSTRGLLWRIAIPLIAPGMAATAVLAFLWTWNDLLITLVLSTRSDTEMITLGLSKFVLEYGVDWGSMTAAGVIMFIPTLLFVFIAQRYLISGLTSGGVKE